MKKVRGVPAPFPKVLGDGPLGRAALAVNLALIRVSRTMFSYQFFIEAETTPDVDFVVRDTMEKSDLRAALISRGGEPRNDGGAAPSAAQAGARR